MMFNDALSMILMILNVSISQVLNVFTMFALTAEGLINSSYFRFVLLLIPPTIAIVIVAYKLGFHVLIHAAARIRHTVLRKPSR